MIFDDRRRWGLGRSLCNLHVCHRSPELGMNLWAREFSRSDPFSDNLVLESVGRPGAPILEYHLVDGGSGRLIDSLFLRSPISETETSHAEYRQLVEALCRSRSIAHLYILSMIGHSPELMELGIPVTIVHHDHHSRRELGDQYLQATATDQVTHVAPSHGFVQAIRKTDPRFQEVSFVVIENGLDAAVDCFGGATDGRRLRVVVLGDLELNQGSGLLSQSFETLRLLADLYLVGSGESGRCFESRWGVTVIGSHQEEELTGVLRNISPDLGLLLSRLPHNYGYSLSELQMRGIPPAATGQGGDREIISHGVDGFLFSPDASSLVTLLARLDARREELRLVARRLRCQSLPTVREMVDCYYSLRPDLSRQLDGILEGRRQVEVEP
jgi:glycosyltransferase involved in cell wall biosynthesis